jgi:hypothetical protein
MPVKMYNGSPGATSVRAITGHPTGVTLPKAQRDRNSGFVDLSTRQGRVLANQQPNTDPRRFVIR